MINTSINYLKSLQINNGLFRASKKTANTGYDRIWIRDNLYTSIAFETINDKTTVENIYHELFNIFKKYEWKIDEVIKEKPTEDFKFIHPLYTDTLEEIKEGWGWKQNDAIGGFLFFTGYYQSKNYNIICSNHCQTIIEKLIKYLQSIKYWEDEDNGMWEENKEIHASSVGACVAGLNMIKNYICVPDNLIKNGENSLNNILPKESKTKKTDLSLLSLIYPYNIVNEKIKKRILNDTEKNLAHEKGITRYINDQYYNQENIEAKWTMGLPWMAICYYQLGNFKKYKEYLIKTINASNNKLEMTELFINNKTPNKNTPLAWSQSLLVKAMSL